MHSKFNIGLLLGILFTVWGCSKVAPVSSEEITLHTNWQFRQVGTDEWLKATVPGTVHTDLHSNGKIEDPFYRDNEKKLQWIEKEDWEYKTTFNVSASMIEKDSIDLNFKGLDTYADLYLNGKLVKQTNNMFVGWTIPSKQYLKEGENELKIYFHSPINFVKEKASKLDFTYPADNDASDEKLSIFTRKAPYHYGWDWGPRFVTSGVWKPVSLKAWNSAKIENVQLVQKKLTDELAEVTANFELTAAMECEAILTVSSADHLFASQTAKVRLKAGENRLPLTFQVNNPKRWWPNGLGEAFLYNINTSVEVAGEVCDQQDERMGLRTLEVINEPDSLGESFYVKVNGVPVFMKGANVIPSDSFLPRVTRQKYEKMMDDAVTANMNMLRIWGGGVYESDTFYELADEKGLLVWQDFMFACTLYPGDKDFLDNVRREAIYNVKRLRNHPSLALWCGNNEIQVGFDNWGWEITYQYSDELRQKLYSFYESLFKELLPEVVAEYDAGRFYYPSSPISNWGKKEDFAKGDNHFWGVWHGEYPFESFKEYIPRFMSEFGFQSFPSFKTLQKITKSEDLGLTTEVMNTHQKSYKGNKLIKTYMERDFIIPESFEDFVYVGQLLQAEGMKLAFEAQRRAMPYCMGTLYWQFNDCWPAASWSSIDYYGEWKAMHYYTRKAFAPILVSPVEENGEVKVYIVSDLLESRKGLLKVEVKDFNGKVLASQEKAVVVQPNKSDVYLALPSSDKYKNAFVKVTFQGADNSVLENVLFFQKPKNQQLPNPQIEMHINKVKAGFEVKLTSDKLARYIFLQLDGEGYCSDNYFDLLPGEEKVITISDTTFENAAELEKAIQVKSLTDCYPQKS
ncbi:glycoside hydrolase family 2 protein [Limibacter armeniacum]|uniref:beta-mannosidase n=1 Tax=Limibacter armeniacum TaxID=466084 RepID=UPI002FE66F84